MGIQALKGNAVKAVCVQVSAEQLLAKLLMFNSGKIVSVLLYDTVRHMTLRKTSSKYQSYQTC